MTSLEMITIQELLRDPQYRAYFTKVPKLPDHITPANKPWRLMILKKGETNWRAKRVGTYKEAFDGFKKLLPKIDNAAINCPSLSFMPPIKRVRVKGQFNPKTKKQIIRTLVWKPQIDAEMAEHYWCPYCRRPTVFRFVAIGMRSINGFQLPLNEPQLRCGICGASERIINLRSPEKHQIWDTNRLVA